MFVLLWFLKFSLIGESEGQHCTFPSSWHNKDFTWWMANTAIGFWNFSETTLTWETGRIIRNFECKKIVGRFVIVRNQDTDRLTCYVIQTNNADGFTALRNRQIDGLYFTNECSACSEPATFFWTLSVSAVGTVAQNQTGDECNIPVGCTPGPEAKDPHICVNNGNIEGDSNEETTHPTTHPLPTTAPATPPPKHCKHGHP